MLWLDGKLHTPWYAILCINLYVGHQKHSGSFMCDKCDEPCNMLLQDVQLQNHTVSFKSPKDKIGAFPILNHGSLKKRYGALWWKGKGTFSGWWMVGNSMQACPHLLHLTNPIPIGAGCQYDWGPIVNRKANLLITYLLGHLWLAFLLFVHQKCRKVSVEAWH